MIVPSTTASRGPRVGPPSLHPLGAIISDCQYSPPSPDSARLLPRTRVHVPASEDLRLPRRLQCLEMPVDGASLPTGIFEAVLLVVAVGVRVRRGTPGLQQAQARWTETVALLLG